MTLPRRTTYMLLGGGIGIGGLALLLSAVSGPSQAAPAPLPPTTSPLPAPAPATTPPPPPAATAAAIPTDGLRLHGLSSGAAIIGLPSGRQRLVRVGQSVFPGVTLEQVGPQHVLLAGGPERLRLTFAGAERTGAAPGGASPAERRQRSGQVEQAAFVMGTQPRTDRSGVVTGYTVRRGADLPLLRQAGLREGDVLVSVNGETIDGQERLTQIPASLAGLSTADIVYERGGRQVRTTITLQSR